MIKQSGEKFYNRNINEKDITLKNSISNISEKTKQNFLDIIGENIQNYLLSANDHTKENTDEKICKIRQAASLCICHRK